MSLQNMPSSSNLIIGILGEILRIVSGSGKGKGKSLIEILLIALGVAILFVIATAPYKILLRKNFGAKAISIADIIFGTLFFGLIAFFSFVILDKNYYYPLYNPSLYQRYLSHPFILLVITLFFSSISLVTLIKGFKEESRSRSMDSDEWEIENHRGESLLFQKDVINNRAQYKVWKAKEPAFCFKWSFILLIIHPLLGFPLLFASTAFWVNEWYHVTYKWEKLSELNNNPKFKEENSFAKGNIVSAE